MYRGQSILVTYGRDDLFEGTYPAIVLRVCKASCSVLWTSGEYKNTITYNVSFNNIHCNVDTPCWTEQQCDEAERNLRFPYIDLTTPPKKKHKPSHIIENVQYAKNAKDAKDVEGAKGAKDANDVEGAKDVEGVRDVEVGRDYVMELLEEEDNDLWHQVNENAFSDIWDDDSFINQYTIEKMEDDYERLQGVMKAFLDDYMVYKNELTLSIETLKKTLKH